jgi:uncharacterized protein with ParB-like and HNH nuclease domain
MSYQPPITVKQAVETIERSKYLLPAIQREFVWRAEQIELLFDSLMRDYPFGSLLMWKVDASKQKEHKFYSFLKDYREKYKVHCEECNIEGMGEFQAVLDGQQRLTALYIGLKGSYAYKRKNYAWVDNQNSIPTRKLYLCLSENSINDDENEDGRVYNFRFLTDDEFKKSDLIWLEVPKILSIKGTFGLNKFLKENDWDTNEFISDTVSKLFDVVHVNLLLNFYLETDDDYDKALNIFIRINSGGEKLSYSDLIMSMIISGWSSESGSARIEFSNLIDEVWNSTGIVIDKDLIIRSYLMMFSSDIKFRVSNFTIDNANEFRENWDGLCGIRNAIIEVINLVSQFGYVEQTLTSKNALLPIIYYIYLNNKVDGFSTKVAYKEDREIIKKWFHAVLLKKIFGGQADMVLKLIRDEIKVQMDLGFFPAQEIAIKLSKTRKSINIDDEAIENLLYTSYEDRYSFPILALLYPHLDFRNNDFNKDHIHPKVMFTTTNLKKQGIDLNNELSKYYTDKTYYNGILNLQLLDSNDNKAKNDQTYYEWCVNNNIDFNKQLLPNILEFEKFPEFIIARKKILFATLKSALTF